MISSKRLKAAARTHQAKHPSISYQEALRALASTSAAPIPAHPGDGPAFLAALGIADLNSHDFEAAWAREANPRSLRAPVARLRNSQTLLEEMLWIDIQEAHPGGPGLHGVIVGSAGAGKTTMLATMVVGLAARHSPQHVQFLIADFTWQHHLAETFAQIPHTRESPTLAGAINAPRNMVEEFMMAVHQEIEKRKLVLSQARCRNIQELRQVQPLPALPHLVVIVEHAHEPLLHFPQLRSALDRIGRVGRSLGISLWVAGHYIDSRDLRMLLPHFTSRFAIGPTTKGQMRELLGDRETPRIHQGLMSSGDVLSEFEVLDHHWYANGSAIESLVNRLARTRR